MTAAKLPTPTTPRAREVAVRGAFRRIAAVVVATVLVTGVAVGLGPTASEAADPERVLVSFQPWVSPAWQGAVLVGAGLGSADVVHRIDQIGVAIVMATAGQKAALVRNGLVKSVDADVVVRTQVLPNDPEAAGMTGLADVNLPSAWDTYPGAGNFSPGGPYTGAPVAILDSGLDHGHQEYQPFATKVPICVAYPANPVYDPEGSCDNHPSDDISHGTHVAGTAAANADDGLGVPGVSPTSPIYVYKVCQGQFCWLGDVASALVDAADDGAKSLNMSLGGPVALPPWQTAVNYAVRKGVVVAAAAGNSGNSSYSYPGSFNGVLSVAATQTGTTSRAYFSQYNDQVDLAAPGTSIISSVAPPACGGSANCYDYYSGTSMATPHVSGAAALVRSAHPGWTAGKVRGALLNTATDLGTPGRDNEFGKGRIDVAAALAYSPVADGDLDDDGVADEWDADADDPTRWNLGSAAGAVYNGSTKVQLGVLNLIFWKIGFLIVNTPGNFHLAILSNTGAGTAVNGITQAGNIFRFGSSGVGNIPYKMTVVDTDGGTDTLRLELNGSLVADGAVSSGDVAIEGG